ncbi:hypothetical protein BBJ28_00014222 [Nothophytophthora sp. Chile5]|nr:hypothetical protein BBJ28_00014222 [Nothophytophthora sp. Chile5]
MYGFLPTACQLKPDSYSIYSPCYLATQIDLFHTYAVESERVISRSELFQLLQDHSERGITSTVAKDDKPHVISDSRHFEKLYTWLKKFTLLYDKSRSGFLSEKLALEMLQSHPTALAHLQFQLAPFIQKLKENNARYAQQAAAVLPSI